MRGAYPKAVGTGQGPELTSRALDQWAYANGVTLKLIPVGIRTAFYSGMRMSAILRAIPIKDGFSLGTTKNGRPRLIPIHPRIAVIVRRVKFAAPAWKIKDKWIKARRRSGHLGVRFHDRRHSAASEMINAGIDLYTVAGVLGHKTTSTKRYAHLVTDRIAEAVKKIGRS